MEILKVKQIENGYLVNDVMSVPNDEGNKDYQAVLEYIANGGIVEPEFTPEQIETTRVSSISSKATSIIEALYSPLKQRKLMSQVIALKDKRDDLGVTLTAEENAVIQNNRDINTWITNIRTIENTAILENTLLVDVVWE